MHVYIGVGIRPRMTPLFPEALVGSPLLMADVAMSGHALSARSVTEIATRIPSTLSRSDEKEIGAKLHRTAYQLSLYIWNARILPESEKGPQNLYCMHAAD